MQYALLAYGSQRTHDGPVEDAIADVLARPYVTGWARLHADESATTVRNGEGRTLLTDGPFIETKEYLAGVIVVEADNLDAALAIAQGTAGHPDQRCDRAAAVRSPVCLEAHPAVILWTWDEDRPRILEDRRYFGCSHVNDTFPARGAVEWQWTLGEIVTTVAAAGMGIMFLGEYPEPFWRAGGVSAAAWSGRLPNSFALLARRAR